MRVCWLFQGETIMSTSWKGFLVHNPLTGMYEIMDADHRIWLNVEDVRSVVMDEVRSLLAYGLPRERLHGACAPRRLVGGRWRDVSECFYRA